MRYSWYNYLHVVGKEVTTVSSHFAGTVVTNSNSQEGERVGEVRVL